GPGTSWPRAGMSGIWRRRGRALEAAGGGSPGRGAILDGVPGYGELIAPSKPAGLQGRRFTINEIAESTVYYKGVRNTIDKLYYKDVRGLCLRLLTPLVSLYR